MLVKDERDKYLERVLRRCLEFSDQVVVLDDGSTDDSDDLARDLGCEVHRRAETGMWGNEAPARAELWDLGAKAAGDGWLLICDADMLLYGDPRPLTLTTQFNAWAWPLFDVWQEPFYYRCDGFWQGHLHPRPWMFRPNGLREPAIWPIRGLHTGHVPANFPLRCCAISRHDLYWLHMAYASHDLRVKKHAQYVAKSDQLSPFELAHAHSIVDT